MHLTQKELKKFLSYDPETGDFRWKVMRTRRWKVGMIAGTVCKKRGYRRIGLKPTGATRVIIVRAHRIAWLYVYGEWPFSDIDHINRNGCDNRIANLRLATKTQNMGNRKRNANNSSGYKGVYKHRNKWAACIRQNGKTISLGTFNTPQEAHAAYVAAAKKIFGEFARAA